MNSNDILKLNINSNAFENLKADFDKVLRRTLGNMQIKESDEATLTLKLSIKLTEMEVPDFDAAYPNAMRKIHKPRFDHKVSSVMQIKTEESGHLKGEYELVWDEEAQDFVMKPIDDGQRTLFDDDIVNGDYAIAVDADDIEEDETKALPEPQRLLDVPEEDGYDYEEDEDE